MKKLIILFSGLFLFAGCAVQMEDIIANKEIVTIQRVVDADTVEVMNNEGDVFKVRVIGLDTPETYREKECYGERADEEAKIILREFTDILLEYDESQGMRDRYGRTLAYIYFFGEGNWLNYSEYMIKYGFGEEYTYGKEYKYQKEFRLLEAEAKNSGVGLWGVCEIEKEEVSYNSNIGDFYFHKV